MFKGWKLAGWGAFMLKISGSLDTQQTECEIALGPDSKEGQHYLELEE